MPKLIQEASVDRVQSLVKAKTHMEKCVKHLRNAGLTEASARVESVLSEEIIPEIEALQE